MMNTSIMRRVWPHFVAGRKNPHPSPPPEYKGRGISGAACHKLWARPSRLVLSLAAVWIGVQSAPQTAAAADWLLYVGTQSTGAGSGISAAHFDPDTGLLAAPKLVVATDGPSFFALAPDHSHLYSTNYTHDGGISSFSINAQTGGLTLVTRITGGGAGTSHISLDRTGRFLLAANFDHAHIAAFAIRPDGSLGASTTYDQHTGSSVNPQRQARSYPHCIMIDPTNHFALVPDLGLDKLFVYRFDENAGTLMANDPPFAAVKPGLGPRHVAFAPNEKWAYLLCEMGSTIVAYNWDSTGGKLTEIQTLSTLPPGFTAEDNSSEIQIAPSGKFLYASNRGEDSIAEFAVDESSGKLTLIGNTPSGGKSPRDFMLDPSGRWIVCANQDGNNLVVFKVDSESGKLTPAGQPITAAAPCGLCFLPMGGK